MGHRISTLSRKSVPCGRHPVSSSDWKHFKPEFCCCEGLMYADRFLASRCVLEEGRDLSTERVSLSSRCVGSQAWGASFLGLPPPLLGPTPPWPRPQIGPAPPAAAGRGRAAPGELCRRGWGSSRSRSLFSAVAGWSVSIKVFFFPFSLAPGNRRRRQAAAAAEREKATRTQTNESGGCALPCTPRRPVPPRAPGPGTTGPSVRLHGPGAMLSGGLEHA